MIGHDEPQRTKVWTPFRNDASDEVPARGVIRITGGIEERGHLILTGDKPSSSFQRLYAVNGITPVPPGGRGACLFGYDGPVCVATEGATPSYGQGWGPKPDSWKLNLRYPCGFTAISVGAVSDTAFFTQQPINAFIGKLDGDLNPGSTATVSVWVGQGGSETDETNWDVSVRDFLRGDISSGKKVKIEWINGLWYCTGAECES